MLTKSVSDKAKTIYTYFESHTSLIPQLPPIQNFNGHLMINILHLFPGSCLGS